MLFLAVILWLFALGSGVLGLLLHRTPLLIVALTDVVLAGAATAAGLMGGRRR